MKLILTTFTFATLFYSNYAQKATEPCFFDNYKRHHKTQLEKTDKIISNVILKTIVNKNHSSTAVKIIPVVVHVIHNGGTENISDAQIQGQITVLNEDFRKIAGTSGDGNGVDTEIEFCLAKKTPDDRCTNGIVRIQSSLANHLTYQRSQLKNLSYWDNTRYLNMYIVKTINGSSGTLGYSSYPGGPPDEDGIVVRHDYFGRIGTAAASLGRTTTHEIGHWLGLYHTFNGGCGIDTCSDGDYVCDTPPAFNPNFGCPVINSCSNDFPDVSDQIQNYMDYSDDGCKSMLTAGQKARMQASLTTLRYDIWQQSNMVETGCDSGFVSPACNVIADFTSNAQNICIGNSVLFTNKTLNDPLTFQWYFTGGTPATSIALNPTVAYAAIGTYAVKLVATGSSGSDSVIQSTYINVSTAPVGQALPFFEDFETFLFPSNGITIDNPDVGITWERDTIATAYAGIVSAKINNLININYGQSDAIMLPRFDFTTFTGTPYLNFKWAYAKSDNNYSDELIVLVSSDCGVTWAQKFYKTGTPMTTGATQTAPYLPDSNTVWKTANINLSTYSNNSNVLIKIVNVTDGGNNLYIDNINLGSISAGVENMDATGYSLLIYPNPAGSSFTIEYLLSKSDNVSYEIMDMTGREIIVSEAGKQSSGLHSVAIQTNKFSSGMYYVKMKVGNEFTTQKFFINK
ncbi:MAG: M43 family zinc metalloprotease [Bacteroidia bacterium]|nr:M43 family zinc metalloprotease [Bacteroidia bacterium]